MNHKIIIPYDCGAVIYPYKPIPIWHNSIQIGVAVVHSHNKVKVAKTDLETPYDLIARGKWVSHEGDKIDEFRVTDFDVK